MLWRSMCLAACGVVWMGASSARAEAPRGQRILFDCQLRDSEVDCAGLASALEAAFDGGAAWTQREEEATSVIEVRGVLVAEEVRYTVAVRDARGASVRLVEELPTSTPADVLLPKLVATIERARAPLSLGGEGGPVQRSGLYARPRLEADLTSAGLTIVALSSRLELSFSTPEARLLFDGRVQYKYLSADIGDEHIEGDVWFGKVETIAAYSLPAGFSAALLLRGGRAPHNNLSSYGEAGLGLEWLDLPFSETNEHNVGVRARVLGVAQGYESESTRGRGGDRYLRGELSALLRLHDDAVDLDCEATMTAPASAPSAWDLRGDLIVTWHVTEGLELALSGALIFRRGALHQPADAGQLDPVPVLLSGSDFGRLSYETSASIAWTFGDALARTEDQRWR